MGKGEAVSLGVPEVEGVIRLTLDYDFVAAELEDEIAGEGIINLHKTADPL